MDIDNNKFTISTEQTLTMQSFTVDPVDFQEDVTEERSDGNERICEFCGCRLPADYIFCDNCGSKL